MQKVCKKTGMFGVLLFLLLMVAVLPLSTKKVQAATGFVVENGYTYYYKADGTKQYGWLTLNGNKYYFYTGSGKMATGWVTNSAGQKRYFYKGSGIMATGWVTNAQGEKRYFYTGSGIMATGWVSNAAGNKRYFDMSTGVMTTGWLTLDGKRYYFSSTSGVMATGWVSNSSGQKRYFDPTTGVMTTGWLTLNGNKYYFYTGSGIMATGWVANASGKNRYFDPSTGIMQTGLVTISGKKYYFNPSDGFMKTGWVKESNSKKRYFDTKDGHMLTGWITVSDSRYYLDPATGYATVNTTLTMEGVQYTFNSEGVLIKTYDPSNEPVQTDSSKTIKNYLAGALQPVGKALYVWGGGWVNATTKGVPQSMIDWYNINDSSYDFHDYRDGSAATRAKGFDCSGFVGWAAYQVMHDRSGVGSGYTEWSGDVGYAYEGYDWGKVLYADEIADSGYVLKAGDVGFNANHTWIILGQCSDKSCVIIHSTDNAGVQIAGTPTPSGNYLSEACSLAKKYMSTYPGYSKYYYHTNSGNYVPNNPYFRWNRATLADPDGYMNMTAAEILYDLFGF